MSLRLAGGGVPLGYRLAELRSRLASGTYFAVFTRVGLLVVAALAATVARAEDWPQWRGAKHDGISASKNLPAEFGREKNLKWRLKLPGPAGSTPVVANGMIYLTTANEQTLDLMAIDARGKTVWQHTIANHNEAVRGDEGNFASPSPCTDGKRVWTMMGTGDLACHTAAGKEKWHVDLQKRYGTFNIQFGMTSTPLLDNDRLYLQLLHSAAKLVVCLDASTGDEVWKHIRESDARAECEHSYASPTLYRNGKLEYLLTHGGDYVVAHDLRDGHELWRAGGLNPPGTYNETLRLVASPVAAKNLIVVPSAKNGPVLGIDPIAAKGNITDVPLGHRWTQEHETPDVPSPLVVDDLVYLCRENGALQVLDASTGQEVYKERVHSDRYRASPVYADGKIYLASRDGTITVVKPGRQFEVLAENKLDESLSSSPAIADDVIYIRTFEALYAFGK